jgi:hypothetical protein
MGALFSLIVWLTTLAAASDHPSSYHPVLYCANTPALVTMRKPTEGESGEKPESMVEIMSIKSWIERSCPSQPYIPTWWLRSYVSSFQI